MDEPTFLASLVDQGNDQICTTETDTDTLDCSMNSALVNSRLRVQVALGKLLHFSGSKMRYHGIHAYMHQRMHVCIQAFLFRVDCYRCC